MAVKILIDGEQKIIFAMKNSLSGAKKCIEHEEAHGQREGTLGYRKVYVGVSSDPAYANKEVYAYVVYRK